MYDESDLTVQQIADLLTVSRATVYQALRPPVTPD